MTLPVNVTTIDYLWSTFYILWTTLTQRVGLHSNIWWKGGSDITYLVGSDPI
jgi:hypothetical protein